MSDALHGRVYPPIQCHACGDTGWVKGQVFLPVTDDLGRPNGWHATLVGVYVSCHLCMKGHDLWHPRTTPQRIIQTGPVAR